MKKELTEIKEKTDNLTITVGDSNTPLSIMNKTRQKINKETKSLNNTTNEQTSTETQQQKNFLSSQHTWNILQDRIYIRL